MPKITPACTTVPLGTPHACVPKRLTVAVSVIGVEASAVMNAAGLKAW